MPARYTMLCPIGEYVQRAQVVHAVAPLAEYFLYRER
jgi:hypothetical protein